MKELINTIGVEFETENILQSRIRDNSRLFQLKTDASIESDANTITGNNLIYKLNGNTAILNCLRNNVVVGTEIVTNPLDSTDNLFDKIREILYMISLAGETPYGERSGYHYHINIGINLQILKNIIRLGKHLEDVFYLIGCNGYEFRGMKNDFTYCRPITYFGPQCVSVKGCYYSQLYNIKDLLSAETSYSFWEMYGQNQNGYSTRYHPVRYTWLNLYSILAHSTLEFRLFNKTLNPYYVLAEIELCKKFVSFVIETSFKDFKNEDLLRTNSIFDCRSKEDIIKTFIRFAEISELDKEYVEILLDIMESSPLPVCENYYIFSHKRTDSFWCRSDYYPKKIPVESIKVPKYVDIHVLRGEN
jgi:hypothetical protein